MTAQPHPSAGRHPLGTVYLLHFDQRYEHAGHYTGWAEDLDRRQAQHQAGGGARLIEVITQAGISFRLARVWPGVTRARERQLKNQGGASRRCPICHDQRPTTGHGRDPAAAQRAAAVPTRGTTPAQAGAFLELNEAFARPVSASTAKQWGRVRGREQIDLLSARVTAGWFEENQLPSQQRAWSVIRRGVQARVQARQDRAADHAEHQRTQAIAGRTRRRLASAREPTTGRAVGERKEAGHER
jgi:predicted GIY-YIG superfamily endonuclease